MQVRALAYPGTLGIFRVSQSYKGAQAKTTSTEARTSSENVTSRFCNHFPVIQRHYVCKMCSNYPGN